MNSEQRWQAIADGDSYTNPAVQARQNEGVATLFNRTMIILTGMIGIAYGATYLTWGMTMSWGVFLLTGIPMLIGAVAVPVWASSADDSDMSPLIGVGVFAGLSGAFVGPALSMYTETLGSGQVNLACAMTLAVTAGAAGLSTIVSFNWRKVESWLMIPLLGLIGYHLVTVFTGIPEGLDWTVSLFGAGLFSVFLLVDFVRIKDQGRRGMYGWGLAGIIAMNIFLDMLNLLLYILRLMGHSSDD